MKGKLKTFISYICVIAIVASSFSISGLDVDAETGESEQNYKLSVSDEGTADIKVNGKTGKDEYIFSEGETVEISVTCDDDYIKQITFDNDLVQSYVTDSDFEGHELSFAFKMPAKDTVMSIDLTDSKEGMADDLLPSGINFNDTEVEVDTDFLKEIYSLSSNSRSRQTLFADCYLTVGSYVKYDNWSSNYMTITINGQTNTAFCLTPTYGTPSSGYYSNLFAINDNTSSVTAAYHYLWGGRGYDSAEGFKALFESYGWTDAEQFGFSHVIMSIMVTDAVNHLDQPYTVVDSSCFRGVTATNSARCWEVVKSIFNNNLRAPAGTYAYYFNSPHTSAGDGNQMFGGLYYEDLGSLSLTKSSAHTSISGNNSCYSLEGAVYQLIDGSGNVVATLTTDANGNATATDISAGTYTLKEVTAPKGYALDTLTQNVTINSGGTTTVSVSDIPLNDPMSIILKKVDADTGEAVAQGSASLAGAQFTVKHYNGYYTSENLPDTATSTWIFETDEDGFIYFSDEWFVSGDDLYEIDGLYTMPLGTIAIEETKAPKGYVINNTVNIQQISAENTGTLVTSYNEYELAEQVIKRDISVIKKSTDERTTNDNGYYNFEGAVYGLFNTNTGEEVSRITLDKNGEGTFKDVVYDNYYIQEISAPTGYLVNTTKYEISDADFDANESVILCDVSDNPQYGKIVLNKIDSETGESEGQGAATIEGAVYQAKNAAGEVVDTLTIGEDGTATSKILPLGKYFINETSASVGYLLDESTHIADIKSTDSTTKVLVNAQTSEEQVKRGDLKLIKVSNGDMLRLANVSFEITSNTTGESHIIVTDKNGEASTAADWNKHTYNTNRGESSEDGVWFGSSDPDDTKGALPYDTYTITELRGDTNAKYDLIPAFEITVTRDGYTIDLGTLTNDYTYVEEPTPIEISTTATFGDGSKSTIADGEVTIVDAVTMTGLIVGNTYKLVGWEMDKVENTKFMVNGEEVANNLEFEATATDMVVEIEFTFDATGLGDTKLVTYEEVYDITDKENQELVAEHKDIDDEGQTVQLKAPTPDENTSEKNKTGTSSSKSDAPKTGDTSKVWVFAVALILAMAVSGRIIYKKRKDRIAESVKTEAEN